MNRFEENDPVVARRALLKAALGAGLGLSLAEVATGQEADPKTARPQPEDRLVFALGERQGQVIAPEDLVPGGPTILSYPMDPATATPRDGSRLNQVLLIRFAPEELSEGTRTLAADGIVAYSAICTHTGCDVSEWEAPTRNMLCSCHYSTFDPREGARVVDGPAPRRLPALPLKVVDGSLRVAGRFTSRVGPDKPNDNPENA